MKRMQGSAEETPPTEGPALKKAKMSPTLVGDDDLDKRQRGREEGEESNSNGYWTKVEKRKKKKTAKNEARNELAQPRFLYSNHEIVRRNNAIGIEDIRDLVLHLIADAPNPNWLRIENGQLIQRVVVLMVPGLTNELLGLPPLPTSATANPNVPLSIPLVSRETTGTAAAIPFIATTFSHACPTRAPGDQYRMHSVLSAFFSAPVTQEERRRRIQLRLRSERSKSDPTQYLLTVEEMIENEYPVPSYLADVFERPPEWRETPEVQATTLVHTVQRKIYAVDCEMCVTEDGKELTRVCIVDYHSNSVIYDQLVKPSKPIVDYLTRFSGITAEHLAPITTTLSEVQEHVLRLLSPPLPNPFSTGQSTDHSHPHLPPILLGHSLESDLKALKISHPFCIDTALMYHHPRGRPLKPGLAWLTKKWCGREIQMRGEGGHDPEEDARACLDLFRRKLEEGPGFGEFKTDQESIFARMQRSNRRAGGGPGTLRAAVVDYGNPVQMHGSKATTAIACKSDEEVVRHLLGVVPSHDFAFARLMGLGDQMGWITQRAIGDAPPPPPGPPPTPEQVTAALSTLNTHLQTIHASLPPRTAFVIFTGHSDPRRMTQLNARKAAFDNALRSGRAPEELGELRWSAADARELEEAVELARRGLLFLGVKS